MSSEPLLCEKQGHVLILTLNRPERMNAVDTVLRGRLAEAWGEFRTDSSLRVAIVTGAGDRAFCAGMDVKEGAAAGVASLWSAGEREPAPRLLKPVLCAVNGVCAGIGMGLIAESDFAICSENATFIDPHVSIGQVSATQAIGLVRRVPFEVIMRMALVGNRERLSAQRALEIGLVTEVVPLAKLMPTAMEIAQRIAANSPAAVMASKEAILDSLECGYSAAIANALRIIREHYSHPDTVEGPRAFVEKRSPQWRV